MGAPMAPSPNTGSSTKRTGLIIAIVGIVVAGALVGGIVAWRSGDDATIETSKGTKKPTDAQKKKRTEMKVEKKTTTTQAPGDPVLIENEDCCEVNSLVKDAIVNINAFWDDEMPKVFDGQAYDPISGGFWAASPDGPTPPCTDSPEQVRGNAFYCPAGDNIAWDAVELLPNIKEQFGDLAVGVVVAHEWGHSVQARVGLEAPVVVLEQQADCYAGSWVQHLQANPDGTFPTASGDIDGALAGLISVADAPGTAASDPSAHGSAFDRANAFQDGLENGAEKCATYSEDTITLVEFPFQTNEDADSNGNAPYDQIVTDITVPSLEDFWTRAFADVYNKTWTPLAPIEPWDSSTGAPDCGSESVADYLIVYCPPDNAVIYDDEAMRNVYDNYGDFAVSALIGARYGEVAMDILSATTGDAAKDAITADCLAGAWTANVFNETASGATNAVATLSPGDMDEAVRVLLDAGSAEASTGSDLSGFTRVAAYRNGVLNGIEACVPAR